MVKYIIKRILMMIPVLIGVTILLFFIQAMTPGDPAVQVLGESTPEEQLQEWRVEHDLDKPIIVQYVEYMKDIILHGDFGDSYRTGKPITGDLMARLPITLYVALLSMVVAVGIGLPLGIVSALHRGKWIDSATRILGMLGVSMPNFWFALLLIILFALNLGWFPVSGSYGPIYYVLPVATLGILNAASIMRYTRSSVLDNVQADFVRTARAKGQKESKVVLHHILGNSMIPITTCIGQFLIGAMAGVVVIEQIFALPGLGTLMINAVNQRDYPQLRGCIILVAVSTALINLLMDIAYAFIDPRIRARMKSTKFFNFKKRKKKEAAS